MTPPSKTYSKVMRSRGRNGTRRTASMTDAMGHLRCIAGDFASEENVVRHTATRLADVVLELAQARAGES